MNVTPQDVAYAMHDMAWPSTDPAVVAYTSQYLLEHPGAVAQLPGIVERMGLDVPKEPWKLPVVHVNEGTHAVRSAIGRLGSDWDKSFLHRIAALHRLSYACKLLARAETTAQGLRAEKDREQNGGTYAGMWWNSPLKVTKYLRQWLKPQGGTGVRPGAPRKHPPKPTPNVQCAT